MRSALVASIVLLIGGCTSDDPSQGGFFGGLAGLGFGSYEQRITDKTASWSNDEQRYQEEVTSKNELDATIRGGHDQVIDMEQQAATLESDIATLSAEIEALQTEKTVTSNDLAKAESNITSLMDDIIALRAVQAVQEREGVRAAETAGSETATNVDGGLESDRTIELRAYITQLDQVIEALKSVRKRSVDEAVSEVLPVTN